MKKIKDDENKVLEALNELLVDTRKEKEEIFNFEYFGENGLVATAEIDGCTAWVFNDEKDAYNYVLNEYGPDYVESALPYDEWVSYLINGGVDEDEAESIIANGDWRAVTEIILDADGVEWFLGAYYGEVWYYGDYVIYF